MIVYHPAFDFYHGAYRMLLLLERMKRDSIEVEALRIWDFYFVFPNEVKNLSFPTELAKLKRVFKEVPNPYEDIVNAPRIFNRMRTFQLAALRYLSAHGFIDTTELQANKVKRTPKPVPESIAQRMTDLPIGQDNVVKLLISPFVEVKLGGKSGLKERSGLLEHRYDLA